MDAKCATCRHYHVLPPRVVAEQVSQGFVGYAPPDGAGWCHVYPRPMPVPSDHHCGKWSSVDGRTAPQVFTHAALEQLTKAQAALARAAYALREAGKGMAAEAAHRASKEAAQAIEELG